MGRNLRRLAIVIGRSIVFLFLFFFSSSVDVDHLDGCTVDRLASWILIEYWSTGTGTVGMPFSSLSTTIVIGSLEGVDTGMLSFINLFSLSRFNHWVYLYISWIIFVQQDSRYIQFFSTTLLTFFFTVPQCSIVNH